LTFQRARKRVWVEHLATNYASSSGRIEGAAGPNHCGNFVPGLGSESGQPISNTTRRTEDQEFHLENDGAASNVVYKADCHSERSAAGAKSRNRHRPKRELSLYQ
jgi:hypothetical protein